MINAYCGFPSPATPYMEQPIDLIKEIGASKPECFLARANGDSMIPAVLPEDILVVNKLKNIKSGDIVLAWLNGSFLVKRVFFQENEIKLFSDNNNYPPLIISERSNQDFEIWGKIVSIIRQT